MSSRGLHETARLRQNLEEQMDRLMQQLTDLEDIKNDLDHDEFEDMRNDTLEQLKEFKKSLDKMLDGNLSLVDELGSMQLAIQAAITNAFQTPEVLRLFARKQPGQLRQRLENIKRDVKICKMAEEDAAPQMVEVLTVLKKLGDHLTVEEITFLQANSGINLLAFEDASSSLESGDNLLGIAGSQVELASN